MQFTHPHLCVIKTVNGIHGVLGCSQILEWSGKWLLQVWVVVFSIIGLHKVNTVRCLAVIFVWTLHLQPSLIKYSSTSCPLTSLFFVVQIPNNGVNPHSPLCIETVNGIHCVLGCSQILQWSGKWLLQVWVYWIHFKVWNPYCLIFVWNTSSACWVCKVFSPSLQLQL